LPTSKKSFIGEIDLENILSTPDEVWKLASFASAKSPASPKLTQVGTVIGSLKYISPEQVKGNAEASERSDLYSGDGLLRNALRAVPFDSPSQFDDGGACERDNQTAFRVDPAVPKELDAVVLKVFSEGAR
jgi:serine/threonine-protein kinase